ncbi:MAG: 3-phosphoshikimate 1-carboxyvinyltransferase [Kiritimatiellia bacterium]
MKLTLNARTTPLLGTYRPAGDKSLSHRALLLGALAEGESVVERFLVSGVTRAMLHCLSALGVAWTIDEAQTLRVHGRGLHGFLPSSQPLYCGNSATTFRLLAGALAGAGIPAILTGSEGLSKRPMDRIVTPLCAMGAKLSDTQGCAPIVFSSATLRGITYAQPVASAQVKSCLILAALSAQTPSTFTEPGPSRDHTERMLLSMGAKIEMAPGRVTVFPQIVPLQPLQTALAGDISSAAFLMVAASILPNSDFLLERVGINPTRTGILDVLRRMGADITIEHEGEMAGEPVADIRIRYAALHGTHVSGDEVVRMIDEFPALMIAAACADGETVVREAAELRTKESDRLAIMTTELRRIGITMDEYPDGFRIVGGKGIFGNATCQAQGDHRVAMSLILAGLVAQHPMTIEGAEIIQESFPDFTSVLGLER